jgi:arginine N-succinyltransferase
VASKFFRLPFDEADRMSASTDGQFILDLAPRHPIYLELLPQSACESVARVHDEGVPAHAMLAKEGFRYQGLVDIFDAGPTVVCPRDDIRTVRDARPLRVEIGDAADETPALVSTAEIGRFRAVRTPVTLGDDAVVLGARAADALQVKPGEMVRVKP